ncbi:Ribosomal protein L34e superfamily protein [Rhynchospora pubera]|uniref:Ribosomal protein L34e superfamily protein n=1 Tax=Rhynchospora pubera TaxID=906938 RepID=A0AAV8E2Q8_9POAL|nr:Ribosomal protein L34e superfamily protein [Rhynchospora pubera]
MLRRLSLPSSIMPLRSVTSSSSKRIHSHKSNPYPYPYPPPSISFSASSCKHPPSATLDLLILILVLFSSAFLVASSLSHIARSLSPFLSPLFHSLRAIPLHYLLTPMLMSFPFSFTICLLCRHLPRRKCRNPRCRGLKKALEFDVQLQTEETISDPAAAAMWKEIDSLPWKGGQGGNNPDYECLRVELRKMAPPNGRAVLLFRSRCGCPLAKLEAWGPKRGRRHKKGTQYLALEGGVR